MSKVECEICKEFEYCDTHHIHSLALGGKNTLDNRCTICPNCHRKVHKGKIIIEGRFRTTSGIIPMWRNEGDQSISGLSDPPVWKIKKK